MAPPGYILLIVLAACGVVALVAAVWAGRHGWQLFLAVRRFSVQVLPIVDDLGRRSENVVAHAETLAGRAEAFETALLDLSESAHRLTVLVQAMQEAQGRWQRVTGFVR